VPFFRNNWNITISYELAGPYSVSHRWSFANSSMTMKIDGVFTMTVPKIYLLPAYASLTN
jgi:hypothetical protein